MNTENYDCEGYSLVDGRHKRTGLRRYETPLPTVAEERAEKKRQKKIDACQVRKISGDVARVLSPSGNEYTVRRSLKTDAMGSYYMKYSCDCHARGECVHIMATQCFDMQKSLDDEDNADYDLYEMLGNAQC